jgi:hypothetical protein
MHFLIMVDPLMPSRIPMLICFEQNFLKSIYGEKNYVVHNDI